MTNAYMHVLQVTDMFRRFGKEGRQFVCTFSLYLDTWTYPSYAVLAEEKAVRQRQKPEWVRHIESIMHITFNLNQSTNIM